MWVETPTSQLQALQERVINSNILAHGDEIKTREKKSKWNKHEGKVTKETKE